MSNFSVFDTLLWFTVDELSFRYVAVTENLPMVTANYKQSDWETGGKVTKSSSTWSNQC